MKLHPDERGLGDKAYIGNDDRYWCSFKEQQNVRLAPYQEYWNAGLEFYRARGEHVMHEIQLLGMFRQKFRGTLGLYTLCVDLSVHMTALKIRIRHATNGPRYKDRLGPLRAFPGAPLSHEPL